MAQTLLFQQTFHQQTVRIRLRERKVQSKELKHENINEIEKKLSLL